MCAAVSAGISDTFQGTQLKSAEGSWNCSCTTQIFWTYSLQDKIRQNIKHKAQKRTKWEKMWHPPFLTTTFVPSTMCSHQPHTDPGLQEHILPTSNRLKYQFSLLLHFQAHSATAGARGETLSRQKAKRSSKIKKEKYKPALRAKCEQRPSLRWCLGFLLPSEMFEMCLRTSTTVTGYCSS